MPDAIEILARLRDSLQMADPEWDVSPGTPEYRILEAFALELASVSYDSVLQDYHFDIDKKFGAELDNFVALFGFTRLPAKRATGSVVFSRGAAADQDYVVPSGTQVLASRDDISPPVYYQTIGTAILERTTTQVESPVEAVEPGAVGNVASGRVTMIGTTLNGPTAVINQLPMTGGRDAENDVDLKARWKNTVFRNMAGTVDQFLALALNEESVSRALVVGPVSRFREQLQIIAGQVTSRVPDSKYSFPAGGESFGYNIGGVGEDIASRDVDYNFRAVVPPVVTILDAATFPDNAVVDLEHEYTPIASRNDPAKGVIDKVDIFVAGEEAQSVVEELRMSRDPSVTFFQAQAS